MRTPLQVRDSRNNRTGHRPRYQPWKERPIRSAETRKWHSAERPYAANPTACSINRLAYPQHMGNPQIEQNCDSAQESTSESARRGG